MCILSELENFDSTPDYAATLKQFSLPAIAHKAGITSSYLSNLLTGHKAPSKKLDAKLRKLAEEIRAAQAERSK